MKNPASARSGLSLGNAAFEQRVDQLRVVEPTAPAAPVAQPAQQAYLPRRDGGWLGGRRGPGLARLWLVTLLVWKAVQPPHIRLSHERLLQGSRYPYGARRQLGEEYMQVQQMISTHPDARGSTNDALIRCIEECYSCAQTCTSCGDACLAQDMVKDLTQCVRLNLDCADVCNITGRIATRRTGSDDELIRRMLLTCAAACRLCGDECERHASQHEHCRICAEACRRCMQACQEVGRSMAH
jgi:hypothetical protein